MSLSGTIAERKQIRISEVVSNPIKETKKVEVRANWREVLNTLVVKGDILEEKPIHIVVLGRGKDIRINIDVNRIEVNYLFWRILNEEISVHLNYLHLIIRIEASEVHSGTDTQLASDVDATSARDFGNREDV